MPMSDDPNDQLLLQIAHAVPILVPRGPDVKRERSFEVVLGDGRGYQRLGQRRQQQRAPATDRDLRLHADNEAGCQRRDVVAGQDRDDPVRAPCGIAINREDLRMRMRRAQDRGV